MLPDLRGVEEGKLLFLQLLGLQDTLDATAASSQPQQLSSSFAPWWSIRLALIPELCPHFVQLWLKTYRILISFSLT